MFLVILHLIVAIALIAIVLMQSGKTAGLSGSIAGGAETFFGKNKNKIIILMKEKELQSIFGYKHHYHYTVYYLYQRAGQKTQKRS